MARVIVNRLIQLLFVIVAVSSLLFVLMRSSGDPVYVLYGDIDAATHDQLVHELGFDRPLIIQYADFWKQLIIPHPDTHGDCCTWLDFGESLRARRPAMSVVMDNLGNTISLALVSLGLAIL